MLHSSQPPSLRLPPAVHRGQEYPNQPDFFAMVCMVWIMQTPGRPNKLGPKFESWESKPKYLLPIGTQTISLEWQPGMQSICLIMQAIQQMCKPFASLCLRESNSVDS